jgi:hypothetical protein
MMLEKHGIIDRRSFKRWALKNHPDKVSKDMENEATELFKAIKNCMESEQVGQGFFDSLVKGFSLAGDIASGIVKDPVGAAEMIGETFSKKETWDAIDKHFREDEGFQKALGITTAVTDKLEKVLGAIPGVGQISDVVFKGWNKLTGEYKAPAGAKLTNKMRDWGHKADQWDRIRKKHPDIGGTLMETVFDWFKKLGASKYKAKLPMIIKDHQRRVKLFNKYLEADVRAKLADMGKLAVMELQNNKRGKSNAILKAIKSNPKGVSSEFRRALQMVKSGPSLSKNLSEVKSLYDARLKKAMKKF